MGVDRGGLSPGVYKRFSSFLRRVRNYQSLNVLHSLTVHVTGCRSMQQQDKITKRLKFQRTITRDARIRGQELPAKETAVGHEAARSHFLLWLTERQADLSK